MAGLFWLICILSAVCAFMATSRVVVGDDASGTASNMVSHRFVLQLGFVANLISGASYVGVTALLYVLLKPVGRTLSLGAAFFGLVGLAIGGVGYACHLAPLVLLRGVAYSSAFTTNQLHAIALMALNLEEGVFGISLLFFGFQCFLAGVLIVRSSFLPRSLGFLLASGGCSYVIASIAGLLLPAPGARAALLVMPIALLAEGAVTMWLLIKGVDAMAGSGKRCRVVYSIRTAFGMSMTEMIRHRRRIVALFAYARCQSYLPRWVETRLLRRFVLLVALMRCADMHPKAADLLSFSSTLGEEPHHV